MIVESQKRLRRTMRLAIKNLKTWNNKEIVGAYGISQTAYRDNKNKDKILKLVAIRLLLGELNFKVVSKKWNHTASQIEDIKIYECGKLVGVVPYNSSKFTEEQQAQLKKSGVCFVSKEEMSRLFKL